MLGTTQTFPRVILHRNPLFSRRPGPQFILRGFIIHMCTTTTTSPICLRRTGDTLASDRGWTPFRTTFRSPDSPPAVGRTGQSQRSCQLNLQIVTRWKRRLGRLLANSRVEYRSVQKKQPKNTVEVSFRATANPKRKNKNLTQVSKRNSRC